MNRLADFVKIRRKSLGLTQTELAQKAGVGLRFVRDLEQGKKSIKLDKVNTVLALFSHELGPVEIEWENRP
jgi:y4mF family transcriptional regulator